MIQKESWLSRSFIRKRAYDLDRYLLERARWLGKGGVTFVIESCLHAFKETFSAIGDRDLSHLYLIVESWLEDDLDGLGSLVGREGILELVDADEHLVKVEVGVLGGLHDSLVINLIKPIIGGAL